MAPKIPKGFGAASAKENPSTSSKPLKARLLSKKADSKKVMPEEKEARKRSQIDLKDAQTTPLKRQRYEGAPSLVESQLGPLAASFIKEKDVKSWKGMNLEEENKAMIQASAQLLVQALGRADKFKEERARLGKMAVEKDKLAKQLLEADTRHKKEYASKEAANELLRQEVKDHLEIVKNLSDFNDKQKEEIDQLKARLQVLEDDKVNGWAAEKQKLEDENFERGFNFYLIGFLANDPDYTFSLFGPECVKDIEDFKIHNAQAIKSRRIELGLDEIDEEEEDEGAPSDEEALDKVLSPLAALPEETPLAPQDGLHPTDGAPSTTAQDASIDAATDKGTSTEVAKDVP